MKPTHSRNVFFALKNGSTGMALMLISACGSSYNSHVTKPDDPSTASPTATSTTSTTVKCKSVKKSSTYQAQALSAEEFGGLKTPGRGKVMLPYRLHSKFNLESQVDNYTQARSCPLGQTVDENQIVFKIVVPAIPEEHTITGAHLDLDLIKSAQNFKSKPLPGALFCFLEEKICSGRELAFRTNALFWEPPSRRGNALANSYFYERLNQMNWQASTDNSCITTLDRLEFDDLLRGANLPSKYESHSKNVSMTASFIRGGLKPSEGPREIYVALTDQVAVTRAQLVVDYDVTVCTKE